MLITTIHKGYKFTLDGLEYTVLGSQSMRGSYLYIVRNENTGQKQSISRANMLQYQKDGALVFIS